MSNELKSLGKPTCEQAKAVWEQLGKPATRPFAEAMKEMGWIISHSTVARWVKKGFADHRPPRSKVNGVKQDVAKIAKTFQVLMVPADAKKILEPTVVAEGERLAASPRGLATEIADPPDKADRDRIAARTEELKLESDAELERVGRRALKIMGIVLMEEVTRIGHVLSTIPKDTAPFMVASTDVTEITMTGGSGQMPSPNDPKLIEGTLAEENPVSAAIRKFRKEHELA